MDADLETYIDRPFFNSVNAIAAAEDCLASGESAKAHYVAFLGYAAQFAETSNRKDGDEALRHYNSAAVDPNYRLLHPEYVVDRLVGVGGFAFVFRAHKGDKTFAVKVLKHRVPLAPQVRDALAEALRRLQDCESLHVVKPLSLEGLGATPGFFLMEYVDGVSLRRWIDQKRTSREKDPSPRLQEIDVIEALAIMYQVASGLSEALACEVPHLDLKPDNILIVNSPKSAAQRAELLRDLTKKLDAIEAAADVTAKVIDFNFLSVTHGVPLGSLGVAQATIQYAAPELIQNYSLASFRSDMYSLGIILVEILGGDVTPRTTFSTLTRLAQQEPEVAVLVLACLELDPADRPSSWQTVTEGIQEAANEIRERLKYREKIKSRFSILGSVKNALGAAAGSYVEELLDVVRSGGRRATELAAATATVSFLTGILIARLFTDWWEIDPGFLPCFIVSLTFAWLQFGYFVHVAFRCRLFGNSMAKTLRSVLAVSSFPFIFSAVLVPTLWPFASAGGVAVVLAFNLALRHYLQGFRNFPYQLFKFERERAAAIMNSYAKTPLVWVGGLIFVGIWLGVGGAQWWVEAVAASFVGTVNSMNYFTRVHGPSGTLIVQATSLEYAIRASIEGAAELPRP